MLDTKADNVLDDSVPARISDETFFVHVSRLKALRTFLSQSAVPYRPSTSEHLTIGKIYELQYDKNGRAPRASEWDYVDSQIQEIYTILNVSQRKAFMATETPWLVPILALVLLILGLTDLLILVAINTLGWNNPLIFGGYVLFSTSLGALGALGSLSLNAILVPQTDIQFDTTNKRLVATRIIAGALFGCILSLPFGYGSFRFFIISYNTFTGSGTQQQTPLTFAQGLLLLLPFVFGYSTSAILLVLQKFSEGLERFFGQSGRSPLEVRPAPADQNGEPPPAAKSGPAPAKGRPAPAGQNGEPALAARSGPPAKGRPAPAGPNREPPAAATSGEPGA
ncbi:hypothetical protein ACC718_32830 [Rhizobium ruizarguesonis]|uniref:hypothetical protein n=1 Tax=Rhizobium ruizarguesonis TaxID=2081791 RepID=UPI00103133F4|nr:hypothetical protein [Rhizobium ruizarguesonis]TBC68336.1 hypothetical protein ELH28_38100 [Rhizobium ruizarguesonis]TBD93677.1 hypothetical protein ELH10_35085 [Rhizobium ruizarguesonis]TBF03677.1 hypothetical protein ELG95_32810 [Rhizobium ruizarguesonis]